VLYHRYIYTQYCWQTEEDPGRDAGREEIFVASILADTQLDTPAMRRCAGRCFKKIVELGKSEAEAKEILSEVLLDCYRYVEELD